LPLECATLEKQDRGEKEGKTFYQQHPKMGGRPHGNARHLRKRARELEIAKKRETMPEISWRALSPTKRKRGGLELLPAGLGKTKEEERKTTRTKKRGGLLFTI